MPKIDLSLFAHILLDPYLKGRYELQGSTLDTTLSYFADYLNSKKSDFQHLRAMLCEASNLYKDLNAACTNEMLAVIVRKLAERIIELNDNEMVLMPGGWIDIVGPGHAMLYEFQRCGEHFMFTIYNSGGGLQYHQTQVVKTQYLFCCIKNYRIKASAANLNTLSKFLEVIMIPLTSRFHPKRKNDNKIDKEFNEHTVYQNMIKSLEDDLCAELITYPQEIPLYLLTAGQLSGTCAQRSLHQWLKVKFANLNHYRQFIFDFKMHAFRDYYGNLNKSDDLSFVTKDLIQLAIRKNLRILERLFLSDENEEAKGYLLRTLAELEQIELLPTQSILSSPVLIEGRSFKHAVTPTSKPIEINKTCRIAEALPELLSLSAENLLYKMDELIELSQTMVEVNPLFVMRQIESAVLALPIPRTSAKDSPYYTELSFYKEITAVEHFERAEMSLEKLQCLYIEACKKQGITATSSQFAVIFSLLILRDYFDVVGERHTKKPNFHHVTYYIIAKKLVLVTQSPFFSSYQADMNQRIRDLIDGFSHEHLFDLSGSFSREYYANLAEQCLSEKTPEQREQFREYAKKQIEKEKNSNLLRCLTEQNEPCLVDFYCLLQANEEDIPSILRRQINLEHQIIDGFCYLFNKEKPEKKIEQFSFSCGMYSPKYTCQSEAYSRTIRLLSLKTQLIDDKYRLSSSASLNALRNTHASGVLTNSFGDEELRTECMHGYNESNTHGHYSPLSGFKLDENQIQLVSLTRTKLEKDLDTYLSAKRFISREEYFARELFSLRLVPDMQIISTIAHFSKPDNMIHLNDLNVQKYFEANIFQNNLFNQALRKIECLPLLIKNFIEQGLHTFKSHDNGLNQSLIFFIRLRVLVHIYAAPLRRDVFSVLGDDYDDLTQWIRSLEAQNDDMLGQLHMLRFLNMRAQSFDTIPFKEVLDSYFYMRSKHLSKENAFIIEENYAALDFKLWLQKNNRQNAGVLHEFVVSILSRWVPNCEFDICRESDGFIYKARDRQCGIEYTINLFDGRIFCDGVAFLPIPLAYKDNIYLPLLELGIDPTSFCLVSEDGKFCEFKTRDGAVIRVKKEANSSSFIIQKKINNEWYQQCDVDYKLPEILRSRDIQFWVSTGHNDAIIMRNHTPIYYLNADQELIKASSQKSQEQSTLKLITNFNTDILQRFEDPSFFLVHMDLEKKIGTIDFERYGFSLEIEHEKIKLPGTEYTLVSFDDDSVFSKGVAALKFQDSHGRVCCIVAVQPFYFDPNLSQHYGMFYDFKHDISCVVPQMKISEYRASNLIPNKCAQSFFHHQSASAIRYRLVNNQPMPETTADALYLCYLYLASHKVEKAWVILENLSLTGVVDELVYLFWIIKALPLEILYSNLSTMEKQKFSQPYTPKYVACQLKALALYTTFVALNEPPQISLKSSSNSNNLLEIYAHLSLENVAKFFEPVELEEKIKQLYMRYQHGRRDLFEQYQLSQAESLSLLGFCLAKEAVLQNEYDILIAQEHKSEHRAPQMMPIKFKRMHNRELGELFGNNYVKLEQDYQKALKKLTEEHESEIELRAGRLKFNCIQAQRALIEEKLQTAQHIDAIREFVKGMHSKNLEKLSCLRDQALVLANQQNDINSARNLLLFSLQRHRLEMHDLLRLYVCSDMDLYAHETGLDAQYCLELHQRMHGIVSFEVFLQKCARVLNVLKDVPLNKHRLIDALMSFNQDMAESDPALMLFQYAENKLIRQRQLEVLGSLSAAEKNRIEKVIMGGGKSKVILPLLAEKKANGINLVIIEVPASLLNTNHADLSKTSQELFGKRAHRFEFKRDSDCSLKRLEKIYNSLIYIIKKREYLVTTGETMQSLELKYLELLIEGPDKAEQIYLLEQILALFKACGDAIIDEVHQGLLLKKKLNYTLGSTKAIDIKIISYSVDLYKFLTKLSGVILTEEILTTHPESPLYDLDNKHQILAYLKNESMGGIDSYPEEVKNKLAFYKEQLSLLAHTQSRHYKEHYGPSELQSDPIVRAVAIPYMSSNHPNERSRFGNVLETINYTIQSLLHEGLNENQIKMAMTHWLALARGEFMSGCYQGLNETPTGKRINQLLSKTKYTLQQYDPDNKKMLFELYDSFKDDKEMIFTVLEDEVLPKISVEPSTLYSDAYTHVDIYRTVQGITGTPWNYTTYHQKFIYDPYRAIEADGFIQTLLIEKKTQVMVVCDQHPDDLLDQIFKLKTPVSAVIDVSARFAGVDNLDVARKIAERMTDKKIKYILFFNKNDQLCALSVRERTEKILGSSDADKIEQVLGCSAEARMTYYDQTHTVGTDLAQGAVAHAVVLADKRTHLQSFLQGCMRMRGLAEQQTLSVIIPDQIKENSIEKLMEIMLHHQKSQLREDNYYSAIAKMKNLVRQDLLSRIKNVKDLIQKTNMTKCFQHYFVESKQTTLFEQYGYLTKKLPTEDLLKQQMASLIADWTKLVNPGKLEVGQLQESFETIVRQSLPLCNQDTICRDSVFDQETEQQQELLKEILVEQERMEECFDHRLIPIARKEDQFADEWYCFVQKGCCTKTLNQACGLTIFSDRLFVSTSYTQVYKNQTQMLGPYLKPSIGILFREENTNVKACLIDMSDLDELRQYDYFTTDQACDGPHMWIGNSQHVCLLGEQPVGIEDNSEYKVLIEQIKLFGGELLALAHQKKQGTLSDWLDFDKLEYFEKWIMPWRKTSSTHLNYVKETLLASQNIGCIGFFGQRHIKQISSSCASDCYHIQPFS